MALRRSLLRFMLLVTLTQAPGAYAGLCALESRAVESPNGKYLLVLLTPEEERESRWEKTLAEQDRLEAKYPRSGLYRNDGTTELLWPMEYLSRAKKIYVCNDGIHLVVTFLNWDSGISDRGSALGFYKNGVLQKSYHEQDLLACYYTRHIASNVSGTSRAEGMDAVLDEAAGTFDFRTNWGDAFQFDIQSGKLLSARGPWTLQAIAGALVGVFVVLLFVGWILWKRAAKCKCG